MIFLLSQYFNQRIYIINNKIQRKRNTINFRLAPDDTLKLVIFGQIEFKTEKS